jgi:uncharacterized membrane protein YfcA
VTTTVVVAIGALLGMTVQRSTGLGFALTAVPIFSLVLGAYQGVLLANALAIPVTGVVLLRTWRNFERRRGALLMSTAALAVVPGVIAAKTMPQWALQLLGATVILLSLAFIVAGPHVRVFSRPIGLPSVGATAGFLNGAVAMGGPPIAIYANATGWHIRGYVPTMQFTFVAMNVTSLALKGWPVVSGRELAVCGIAIILGLLAGGVLVRRMSAATLMRMALTLAIAGALSLLGKALLHLLA